LEPPEERPDAPEAPEAPPVAPSAPSAALSAAPPSGPSAPSARRRRGPLLIAGAAVLGLIAGACAGYLIQADRAPTALPSLSQPVLEQAEGEPEPLSPAQDPWLRTEGDLRKLLLKKPAGAKDAEWVESVAGDGWMDLATYAETYKDPAGAYAHEAENEFRRAAVVGWQQGDRTGVEIRLVQYRQEEYAGAAVTNRSNLYWSDRESDSRSSVLPGTEEGRVYVHTRPRTKAGYVPEYHAEAYAWRGDVCLEIYVTGTRPVARATVTRLAERQLERL
jgi:hypothetical protein